MKKRFLSALLALAMVVTSFVCVPFSVAAAVEVPEGSFISDTGFSIGTYSLKGSHTGSAADPIEIECDVTIPDLSTFTGGTIGWGSSGLLLTGISHWRDLSVMIQYDLGAINYRNGDAYVSTGFGYAEGTAHFRLTIDTNSKTYSVWYTEPGSNEEVQVANNANFRSDTAKKDNIGVVNLIHSGGSSPFYISNHYVNGVLVPDPNDKPVEREPVILSVGPGKPYATPAAAMSDAQDGDIIEIDAAGTYYGENALLPIAKKNITIRGINGTPKMEVPTDVVVGGKGIWLIMQGAENVTIENIHFYGANGSGSHLTNAAGVRLDAEMTNVNGEFKFINCKFEHCNNGLLGGLERKDANETYSIRFENCEFYETGWLGNQSTDPGFTHGIYVGNATQLIYRYNYAKKQNEGHLMKSRAHNNFVEYNYVIDGPTGDDAGASANLDFANGGRAYVVGNILEKGSELRWGVNHYIVKFGHEGTTNRGSELYVINNTMVSNREPGQHKAKFVSVAAGTETTVINNIFAGIGEMEYNGSPVVEKNNVYVSDAAAFFADAANYDYHLTTASTAAIDKGTSEIPEVTLSEESAAMMGTETYSLYPVKQYTFRDAEARPVDGPLDIGAYEFVKLPGVELDPLFGRIEAEALEATNAVLMNAMEWPNLGVPDGRYEQLPDYVSKNAYSKVDVGQEATFTVGKVSAANTLGIRHEVRGGGSVSVDVVLNGQVAKTITLITSSSRYYDSKGWDAILNYSEYPVDIKEGDVLSLVVKNNTDNEFNMDYINVKNINYDDPNYVRAEAESLTAAPYQGPNAHEDATGGFRVEDNGTDGVGGGKVLVVSPYASFGDDCRSYPDDAGKDSGVTLSGLNIPADGKYNVRLGLIKTTNMTFTVYIKDEGADDSTYVQLQPVIDAENRVNDATASCVEGRSAPTISNYQQVELTAGNKVLKIVTGNKFFWARGNVRIDYFEFAPVSNQPDPVALTDVAVSATTADSITATWTAPAGVASYDVRYSQYPITEDNWKVAQKMTVGELVEAGQTQTATATGLNAKTKYYVAVKWSNADKVVSPASNLANGSTADNVAPAKVVLSSEALGLTKDTVKLYWRAVGDDGVTGAAASYELRYSTAPITAENFAQATLVSGTPVNLAANTFVTVSVENLSENSKYYFAVVAKDAVGNASELSDVIEVSTKAAEAPAKITNLVASPVTSDWIRLTWTAVGDDKFVGTAGSYDLRMSEEPITEENFEAATKLDTGAPNVAGSAEIFDVGNLDQNKTYYFAIKVISRDGRFVSELSNVPSARPYADKGNLRYIISEARVKVETNYTDDSWAVFAEKLANAVAVDNDANATVEAVATATSELIAAMEALEYKDSNVINADLVAPIDNVVFYPANIVFKVALTPVKDMNMLSLSFNYDPAEISFVSLDSKYEKLEVFQLSVDENLGKITAMLVVKGSLITNDEAADYVELTFVPVDPDKIMGEGEYEEATPLETGLTLTHFLASGIDTTGNGIQFVSEIRTSQADVTVSSAGDFDVTQDGKIDAADLSLILYHFNKSGDDMPVRCDIVKDGIIDVADILSMIAVIRYFNPTLLP